MLRKTIEQEIDEIKFLRICDARKIKDDAERSFALLCLSVGLLLKHQIPVGDSTIDFLVVNPKSKNKKGKLVEITMCKKDVLKEKEQNNGSYIQSPNLTYGGYAKNISGQKFNTVKNIGRKARQLKRMQDSGYAHTMLFRNTMEKILQNCIDLHLK